LQEVIEIFLVLGHNYSYTDVDSILSSVIFAEIWTVLGHPSKAVMINHKGIKESTIKILEKIRNIEIPQVVTKTELENSDIIMVDHNDPEESYGKLGITQTPYMIIDHHIDIGLRAEYKIIEQVGSTCTLVAEISKAEGVSLTERQARILAFGIISDTRGLKGQKTSERDIKMIDYLYKESSICESVETIAKMVIKPVNIKKMSIDDILRSSLKEYKKGTIAIAAIEVSDDGYKDLLEEIGNNGYKMGYGLYVLMIIKHHAQETEILYFDRDYGIFPKIEQRKGLVSRGKSLVPEILEICS